MTEADASPELSRLVERVESGSTGPLFVVCGDPVLAEPSARRLAEALGSRLGVEPTVLRRPADLNAAFQDLKTFSLFDSGKVLLVIESAVLADRAAAADLVDMIAEVPSVAEGAEELSAAQTAAASRLFQVLRLFGVDPAAGEAEATIGRLPDWVFQGGQKKRSGRGSRGRGKKQVAELRNELVRLLEAGRAAEIRGWAESDAEELGNVLQQGLPEGHALVLAESHVAADHPVAAALEATGQLVRLGQVEVDRRGEFTGLAPIAQELAAETGRSIEPDALRELARRTLRRSSQRGARDDIDHESTARLAAEYRKLAALAPEGIDLRLVEEVVEDRGEEDVWKLLDAVGDGRADEALQRLRRLLLAAEDPVAARLSVFSLLADFCRQLTAVQSLARLRSLPFGERNYNRFKSEMAPALQEALPDGSASPVAGMHPFRLFRIYRAAARLQSVDLSGLPGRVLETEQRLKGESGSADTALGQLVAAVSLGGRRRAAR